MPFGDYDSFADCVAKNKDKGNAEAYCAWLHHKITGKWPTEASKFGEEQLNQFEAEMDKAVDTASVNWQFQAVKTRTVANIEVFSEGTWADSSGTTREWTSVDLDKMVEAFKAGKPEMVPLKVGHSSDAFNRKVAEALGVPVEILTGEKGKGQVALGRMKTLEHREGKLVASFENVPEPLADLVEGGQFVSVSSEIEDSDGGPILEAVALLGAEEPAIGNLKPLETAMVFQKGGKTLTYAEHSAEIPAEELRKEFGEIEEKVEGVIKSKRGARIFRVLWQELVKKFELIAGKHSADVSVLQEGKPPKDWWDRCVAKVGTWEGVNDVPAFCGSVWFHDIPIPRDSFSSEEKANMAQEVYMEAKFQGDALTAILGELGLGEGATLEDILGAIKTLKEKAMPPEMVEQKAQFSKMSSDLEALRTRNKELEHDRRVAKFQKIAEGLKAIPGKPEELAAKWVEIEEEVGEEMANEVVAQFQTANKMAEDKAILRPIGRAKPQGETRDEFEKEVLEFAKANNLTYERALAQMAIKKPKEFAAYHERKNKE